MPGMKDELTLLSASLEELPFLDEALEEVGENPSDWIPVFLQKVKADKERRQGIIHE